MRGESFKMVDVNPFGLNDRRILLTGATGHLGSAIAHALVGAGAELLLASRSLPKLEKLARQLQGATSGRRVQTFHLDLSDAASRCALAGRIKSHGEKLHGIVNNAYGGRSGGVQQIEFLDFADACSLNLAGPFHLIQLLVERLAESAAGLDGGCSIVNVASMYGHVSPDRRVYETQEEQNPIHYGATKAGLIQMTRHLACHLAPKGIRVNSISPGAFPNSVAQCANPGFVACLERRMPMARIGQPNEIAYPVQFLLSPASSYVTGIDFRVDGGWSAW